MISSFWGIVLFVNWIVNVFLVEFFAIRKLTKIINVDEERDGKNKAFRRVDTVWFNRAWLFLTCHLTFIKIITCFS